MQGWIQCFFKFGIKTPLITQGQLEIYQGCSAVQSVDTI
jgi:hypothetical protein